LFLFSSFGSDIPRDRSSHPICDSHVGVISSFFIWFSISVSNFQNKFPLTLPKMRCIMLFKMPNLEGGKISCTKKNSTSNHTAKNLSGAFRGHI
jgi:hypothetical protein